MATSRCFRRVMMLVRGASAKFWAQVAALSLFSARSDAGTCSVLESQGVSGDLFVVFDLSER